MSFLEQVKNSIIDFDFYKQVVNQKASKTFGYFAILILIVGFTLGTSIYIEGNQLVSWIISELDQDFPEFRLENGELHVAGNQPYLFENGHKMMVLVDTTREPDPRILDGYVQGLILTKHYMLGKTTEEPGIKRMDYDKLGTGITFDKQDVLGLAGLARWIVLLVVVLAIIWLFIAKLVGSLFLTLLGFIAGALQKADLTFHQLWNISVYALTVPIFIKLLVDISDFYIPYFSLLYWVIAFVYLYKAVGACCEEPVAEQSDLPNPPEDSSGIE